MPVAPGRFGAGHRRSWTPVVSFPCHPPVSKSGDWTSHFPEQPEDLREAL